MKLTILATLSYSLMLIALNRGPLLTNGYLVGALINFFGAAVPFAVFAYGGLKLGGENDLLGIAWGVAGGIGIALFTISMTLLFAGGGSLGFVSPLVYGGSIVLVTCVGLLFLGESLSLLHKTGVALVVLGIFLIVYAKYRAVSGL